VGVGFIYEAEHIIVELFLVDVRFISSSCFCVIFLPGVVVVFFFFPSGEA
jgi:hypothetical protein